MSIFVDEHTKVVVQGLTGGQGRFHALRNRAYGTKVVAGVRAGKGGQDVEGIPVYDTVAEAKATTGANASFVSVPPAGAPDAILEAAAAGIPFVVCITEGIPAHDRHASTTFCSENTRVLACSVRTAPVSSARESATSVSRRARSRCPAGQLGSCPVPAR